MGVIADLLVRVGADTTSFSTGLAKVNTGLDETAAKGSKFGGLMAGAGLLAAGAVTGVVAFGVAAVAHAEEAGQAAYEMSEKFGLAKGTASAYLAVGQQLGLSGEQIGKGFQFLSKNVTAMQLTLAAGGKISATTGQVYKDLGINVFDAGGKMKSADELMLESADAFAKMQDGPEKAALAMKLFGKSGTDLLPMLNLGRKGIEDMKASGSAMGAAMSGPQVEAAHKLYLEHKQLDTALAGVSNRLGSALMPIAIAAIPVVLGLATQIGHVQNVIRILQPWFPLIAAGLVAVAGVIGAMVIPAFILWTTTTWAHVTAAIALAVANLAAMWPILLVIGAIALLVGATILIIQHWDFLKSKTLQVWSDIKVHVMGIVDWFRGLPTAFHDMATRIGSGIWEGIKAGLVNVGTGLRSIFVAGVRTMISFLPGPLQGPILGAFRDLGLPGFRAGGIVGGDYFGQPRLVVAHAGEEFLGLGGRPGAGGGDMTGVESLLRELNATLRALAAPPSGQTGTEAALWKAMQGAGMNRLRGAAGA